MSDHAHLLTEQRLEASRELDALSTSAAFDVLNREDAGVAGAVADAREEIVAAVERIAERLGRGGRLFYVGAGTSGRLGALDAAECPPTFRSNPELVQALIAGGPRALVEAVEGAEDDRDAARRTLAERGLGTDDAVLGIAASGTTPYVLEALRFAREEGAATLALCCVPAGQAPIEADVVMRVVVGPEVLTGSTRLKAGTATKLVLNALSTLTMVRLGKVHENLMVDLDTRGNAKLGERGARIVATLTGLDTGDSARLLERADGQVKLAVVMDRRGVDVPEAREILERAGGSLRRALEDAG